MEGCDDAVSEAVGVVLKAVDLLAVVVGLSGAVEVVGREAFATVGLKDKNNAEGFKQNLRF